MADPIDPTGGSSIPDEQSVKILKEVSETLRQSAEYSRQLADAINSMAKPMQQMNDMHKAIKEQMAEQSKAAKDQTDTAQKTSQAIKDELTSLTLVASTLRDILASRKDVAGAEREIVELEKKSAELKLEATKAYSQTAKETRDKAKETIEHNEALKKQIGIFHDLAKAAGKLNDSLANSGVLGQSLSKAGGTAAEIMTGQATVAQSVSTIGSRLASLVPTAGGIGGLLGLMIYGKIKEAEFHALGQHAIQEFDQVGGKMSQAMENRIVGLGRAMTVSSMIAKGDLMAVAKSFAQTGVAADEAGVPIAGFSKKLGGDLMFASLAADKALEMPAGTMAKMSGVMATQFNTTADKAYISLMNIGEAAKSAGLNAALFMQQVLEASSALRLLNANGEAVGQMQLNFTNQMIAKGHDKRFAAAYAAEGTKSAMQSIANLQVGMAAVVGERMGEGVGLDAWYAMKSGHSDARGGKQIDPGQVASELAKMAQENGRTRAEQVYFLTQLTGSTVGGAETILDAGQEYDKSGGLSKKALDELNRAFSTEADKTSSIERHLAEMKDAFAHAGVGLLSVIINTLKLIYHGIMAGTAYLAGDEESYNAYRHVMGGDVSNIARGTDKVGESLKKVWDAGSDIVTDDFGLSSDGFSLSESEIRRRNKLWLQGDTGDSETDRARRKLASQHRTPISSDEFRILADQNKQGKKVVIEGKVKFEDDDKVHQ